MESIEDTKISSTPICIKNLLLSHNLLNICLCPRCRKKKKIAEIKEFYRMNLWKESVGDPFPEKTGRIEGGKSGKGRYSN